MTDSSLSFKDAQAYLPPGLSDSDLKKLYDELRRLDHGIRYYSPHAFDFDLQGDAFDEAPFVVVSIDEVSERRTRVMLLSNTCDMSTENVRRVPTQLSVAPVVRVSKWRSTLERFGLESSAIENKLSAARRHEISNIFYLAAGQGVEEDSLVLFEQIQSMPRDKFHAANPKKLATLSQAGFWLLLVKLSIHFCRQHEGVSRQAA